ncbi:TRM11 family methyltransferase [Amycolatopsis sp. FDAARGOS 1241]|uniref:TRM11 family SAM-dependent methyltransferase n=1 Tax=Amycolatopsis sp. FDAARGOS 1241 TaxID=2778070 RepID=UPI001950DD94|nr:SAM-dependent methyltransferase [Amycolatopsis sp. FDAARGOS 1241]QRP48704.1 SAM-dependent methyltransferase [Amycolatopsis sp. FDAARGOS 1241]
MPEYVILVHPSANRVYAASAPSLLRAELAVFGAAGSAGELSAAEEVELGGVGYVKFASPEPLSEAEVALLANLSSLYALFELGDGVLRPITVRPLAKTDSDLLTIQKYAGKTNEQFTKLLLNITLLATDAPAAWLERPLRLLDPLCGRGTTLNQAVMYGFDATGLDVDGKDFEAYEQFIKTWLRTKRVKHTADSGQLRRNKLRLGRRLDVEYSFDKDDYKAGRTRRLTYFNADTLTTDELLKPGSVDVIVTDAPYGVQHGSHREAGLARSPRDLLAAAVPVWTRVLRPGGALGISWNTNVLPREDLVAVLARAGLDVREGGPYEEFAHRVDQAIVRDLVVAAKPA